MIRFKPQELGYTVASRQFRNEADKCGSHGERQAARVQHEYDLMCKRHADDPKFLSGVNKAFSEFMSRRNIASGGEADAPAATGPRPSAPACSRSTTYDNPAFETAPPAPKNWDIFEPRSGDAGAKELTYLQAEKGKQRAEMLYRAPR